MAAGNDRRERDEFLSEAQEIVEGARHGDLARPRRGGGAPGAIDPASSTTSSARCTRSRAGPGSSAPTAWPRCVPRAGGAARSLRLGRPQISPAAVLRHCLFRSVELYGRILHSEKEGRDQAIPEVEILSPRSAQGQRRPAPSRLVGGRVRISIPACSAVLTEYERAPGCLHQHRAGAAALPAARAVPARPIDSGAPTSSRPSPTPHGEIITYVCPRALARTPTRSSSTPDGVERGPRHPAQRARRARRRHRGRRSRGASARRPPRRGARPGSIPVIPLGAASMLPPGMSVPAGLSMHPPVPPARRAPPSAPGKEKEKADLGTIRSVAQTCASPSTSSTGS